MEPKKFMVRCAVHLFLIKDGKVLVERRMNREYCDKMYDVIASHIIGNESVIDAVIRTAKVEVNIDVKLKTPPNNVLYPISPFWLNVK